MQMSMRGTNMDMGGMQMDMGSSSPGMQMNMGGMNMMAPPSQAMSPSVRAASHVQATTLTHHDHSHQTQILKVAWNLNLQACADPY